MARNRPVSNTITHTFDAWGRLDAIEDQHSKYDLEYDHLDRLVGMDNLGNPLGIPRAKLTNGFDPAGSGPTKANYWRLHGYTVTR